MKNEIILFKNQDIKLEVNMKDETVWLTQQEMAKLFQKGKSTINEHIKNIYAEKELEEKTTMTKFGNSEFASKPTNYYNLDIIISVGYRVKSKNGIIFRKWANKVLKDHLLKGYSINQNRLEQLNQLVKIVDIASRVDTSENLEASEILKIINSYSKALNLLDDYDYKKITKEKGTFSNKKITYEECKNIIKDLKFNEKSDLFALEREKGLESIISNIYQTYDGNDVYLSIQEKAANLLYLIIKNHVFIDGNKRIGATIFIYFLNTYNLLFKEGIQAISNNTLVAMTLLIAESNPKEKDILINLIMKFLV